MNLQIEALWRPRHTYKKWPLPNVVRIMTYEKIAKRVKATHGWVPKTCWIGDCKGLPGLPVHHAPNRLTDARQVPCPVARRAAIFEAFCHFGMI